MPFELFLKWLSEAGFRKGENIVFFLATCGFSGQPSVRPLFLKDYSEEGFIFYSNNQSKKAIDIRENPRASMCFYFEALERVIRIEGEISEIPETDAAKYFDSRPYKARVGAASSKQSRKLEDYDAFYLEVMRRASLNEPIKKPEYWVGYILQPNYFEFWEGKPERLHRRTVFSKKELNSKNSWVKYMLYP